MSKVYSFRLNDKNPREAQVREVIETWVSKGYSLRYVIVEALLTFEKKSVDHDEFSEAVEQLHDLILYLDKSPVPKSSDSVLSNLFLDSVKQSVKSGLRE